MIAKNERAHRWLQEQFKSRKVEKIYLALVDGKPPTPAGRVEAPIGRNTTHRKLMAVVPLDKGREAVSEYRTLESFPAHTLARSPSTDRPDAPDSCSHGIFRLSGRRRIWSMESENRQWNWTGIFSMHTD